METEPPALPPNDAPPPLPSFEPLEFRGKGKEYFRIWIVNFFLTILTLGFYTPWARVRTRRYFYRNTRLAGHGFDYTADPRKLLLGYLIVAVFLLAYFFGEWISVFLSLGSLFLFLALAPWIRWKSARFRAANSSYRHVRLRFSGTHGEAYRVFLGLPLLAACTFWLLYPLVMFRQRQYYFENIRYGAAEPRFSGRQNYFFAVVLGIGGTAFVVGIVLIFVVSFAGVAATFSSSEDNLRRLAEVGQPETAADAESNRIAEGDEEDEGIEEDEDPFPGAPGAFEWILLAGMGGFYALTGAAGLLIHALLLNHSWSHFTLVTRSGEVAFRCQLHPGRYLWIVMSNLVLILLTLGVFLPFAKVRAHCYRISCMACRGGSLLESEEGSVEESVGATGESASDWLDVEFGL